MHQIAQICTYIVTNFPGVILPDPQNWGGVSPLYLGTCVHRPTSTVPLIQSFPSRCRQLEVQTCNVTLATPVIFFYSTVALVVFIYNIASSVV